MPPVSALIMLFLPILAVNIAKKYNKKSKQIFIITLVIGLFAIWCATPITETITCDENFACKIVQTNFPNIKTTRKVSLEPYDSYLDFTNFGAWWQSYGKPYLARRVDIIYQTKLHINNDKTVPFRKNFCIAKKYDGSRAYCEEKILHYEKQFWAYKLNPKSGFNLKNSDDKALSFLFYCIGFVLILIFLFKYGLLIMQLSENKKRGKLP